MLPTVYNTASNMHNFPYHRYIEGFDKRGFFNYKDLIDITD